MDNIFLLIRKVVFWLEPRLRWPAGSHQRRRQPTAAKRAGGGSRLIGREDFPMNANHPLKQAALIRAALAKVAIPGALAVAACGVAARAFELSNRWTLLASLSVAAACSGLAVRNLYALRRRLNDSQ
jgi:hypothetical protein